MKVLLIPGLLLVLGLVLWYGLRIRRSLTNTIPLHATADQFATEYVVGEATAPTLTYVALGDSTAYGVGATQVEATYPHALATAIAATGYQVRVQTIGRSGARLAEIVEEQLPLVSPGTDLVSVSVGGNDATHLTAPSTFRSLVASLIVGLKQLGARDVLIASTTDMALTPAIPPLANTVVGLWASRQNREMRPAVQQAGFRYVDLYTYGKLDRLSLYASDEFHPNDDGYAKWIPLFVEATSFAHQREQ